VDVAPVLDIDGALNLRRSAVMKAVPFPIAPLTLCAACVLAVGPSQAHDKQPAKPASIDIEMFYQFSATDHDAEVTLGIESPDHPIDFLFIVAPDGHTVAKVQSRDRLGLAEVELESAEPSVEEVQRTYPEGIYRFWGKSIAGRPLVGRIELNHEVIAAPDFFNYRPCNEVVDADTAVTLAWNTVPDAEGGYEIIIEQDDTGANLRISLGAGATHFEIPGGFLVAGLEYEIEMKSVTAAGNKTSASCEFSTR
jgi:hypothetical protein